MYDPLLILISAPKSVFADFAGFDVADEDINPILPHQRAIVRWAVRCGCCAIFAAGLLGNW